VVDSVQTVGSADVEGTPGGVSQVRAVTSALVALAKQRDLPIVLIGHVTKDGAVAGPRTLEHLVDVVLSFEGDRHSTMRMVRGLKNRYGPSDEVGCFEMFDGGIHEVTDPTGLFVGTMTGTVPGQAVTIAMEGKRPLMAEVQGLVSRVGSDAPARRTVSDLEANRVLKILAVLQQRCGGFAFGQHDVFAATVGGMKLREPAADLAIALAIASSFRNAPLPYGVVVLGEVGLTGEVRRVPATDRRLAEAARLGVPKAVIPFSPGITAPKGLDVVQVDDLDGALDAVGLKGAAKP
jgi:DNA repair protein RadA/Sms